MEKVKCLIIGSGPAGYTAAIYAARADMHPVLYTGMQPGGQLTTTNDVENFPGYPEGVAGPQLMDDLQQQAGRFKTDIRFGIITRADLSSRPFHIVAEDGAELLAETLIIATGATARYLGLPSEERFKGRGVSACATCDGFFYRGQDVAVVGGGDTAAEEASYLSKMCRKVYLIHRRNELRASKAMQHRVLNTGNIEVVWDHVPIEILGDTAGVNGVLIENVKTGTRRKLDLLGFFVAIGHQPNTGLFAGQLTLDANGYIVTAPDSTRTNVEGVFACGDVQDHVFRQAITAAGTGCMAALEAERFLAALET
ncbi:MAG TPA: thioredoxin-disulfide reductase [Bacteroidales bacterium]|nr:thioredoxin-disulfide reductase [Bacteroidales bacterium]HNS47220.1 thioredoxin-disulfide reductase [Bacteroidales bacterium]